MLKYHPPTKFCVAPAMGYWELNGRPVGEREASKARLLLDTLRQHPAWFWFARCLKRLPTLVWRESEVFKNLKDYLGWFEEVD